MFQFFWLNTVSSCGKVSCGKYHTWVLIRCDTGKSFLLVSWLVGQQSVPRSTSLSIFTIFHLEGHLPSSSDSAPSIEDPNQQVLHHLLPCISTTARQYYIHMLYKANTKSRAVLEEEGSHEACFFSHQYTVRLSPCIVIFDNCAENLFDRHIKQKH